MRYKKMNDEINFNDLTADFTSPYLVSMKFIGFKGPLNIKHQQKFKSSLSEITSGNFKYRKKYQSDAIENIRNIYNSRQKVINLFNDFAKIRSEAMCKAKYETGLKIFTPKQMFQRLAIALAQVKAGNNSENLFN